MLLLACSAPPVPVVMIFPEAVPILPSLVIEPCVWLDGVMVDGKSLICDLVMLSLACNAPLVPVVMILPEVEPIFPSLVTFPCVWVEDALDVSVGCTWSPLAKVFCVPTDCVPFILILVAVDSKLPVVIAPLVPVINGLLAAVPTLPSFVTLPCVCVEDALPASAVSISVLS